MHRQRADGYGIGFLLRCTGSAQKGRADVNEAIRWNDRH
jgi:hypothetical protein